MGPSENHKAVASELISIAHQKGIDLTTYCIEGAFQLDQRFITLWRKDELPWSGPANEALGTLHYNLQGVVSQVPNTWSEAGVLESIEEAVELVRAWLLDKKEVDDLPRRSVRRSGMG